MNDERARSLTQARRGARRRVPQVREVAVAGDFALIGGHAAWLLARLLTGYPGGLDQVLVRAKISEQHREEVLLAVGALAHVGAEWNVARGSASGSGSGRRFDASTAGGASSAHGSDPSNGNGVAVVVPAAPTLVGAPEAARVLGVSNRRVRRLAQTGALPGHRDAGGRWCFLPADVAAEGERRMKRSRA